MAVALAFELTPLRVRGDTVEVQSIESDQVAPAGRYRWFGTGDAYSLQRALTGEFTTVQDILAIDFPNTLTTLNAPNAGHRLRLIGGIGTGGFIELGGTSGTGVLGGIDVRTTNAGHAANIGRFSITGGLAEAVAEFSAVRVRVSDSTGLAGSAGSILDVVSTVTSTVPAVNGRNTANSALVAVAIFEGDRATPGDGDAAFIALRLSTSVVTTQREYARVSWSAPTVLDGATGDGALFFSALFNNSLIEMLRLDGSTPRIQFAPDGTVRANYSQGLFAFLEGTTFTTAAGVLNLTAFTGMTLTTGIGSHLVLSPGSGGQIRFFAGNVIFLDGGAGNLQFNGPQTLSNSSGAITISPATTLALPASLTINSIAYTFPAAGGTAGQQLQTDGATPQVLSWAAAASRREWKNILDAPMLSPQDALDRILSTRVYPFTFKDGYGTGDYETVYLGILADEAPWAMHFKGGILNPISAFGHTVQAFKAIEARVQELEKELAESRR